MNLLVPDLHDELDQEPRGPRLVRVVDSCVCSDAEWEAAYARFESPAQEVHKFASRLRWFGVPQWNRNLALVELFCGRGNGLVALERLGFDDVEGVDLSESLLAQFRGQATCYVADARDLPFPDGTKDAVLVQGGLHHLPRLPGDLRQVLAEVHRVLKPEGKLVVVEPWLTPFLRFVHWAMYRKPARRLWPRLDALATMTDRELVTYQQWLGMPETILRELTSRFRVARCRRAWGKLYFLGVKK